MSLRYL